MIMKPLEKYVINESNRFSALGRYAKDLSIALNAELFTLRLDSSMNVKSYDGQVLSPSNLLKIGNGWYFNHLFPSISLNKIKSEINRKLSGDALIHYSSQGIPRLNLKNQFVYTVHDLFGLDKKYNKDPKLIRLLRRNLKQVFLSRKIITVSNLVRSKLEEYEGNIEICTIYPPISSSFVRIEEKEKIRKELNLPLHKRLILSVSSTDPRKNLEAVFRTKKILGENYEIVRVGKQLNGEYSFRNVEDEVLNKIYNACDVLLYPSLDEGFGYPIVEAMTVGLPVVASNIEVFKEVAGDSAILVEPTAENLSNGIITILNDADNYKQKGLIKSKQFTFEVFQAKLKEFYDHLE